MTRLLRTIRAVLILSRYFHDQIPPAGPGGGCTPKARETRLTNLQNAAIVRYVPGGKLKVRSAAIFNITRSVWMGLG